MILYVHVHTMDESRNYALELNNRFAKDLFPNTVGLSVILVIGFLGNILVLFVYSWKMKQNMEARYFIPVLAVFDSLTCAVSCWYLIMDNTYFIHYPWDSLCRSLVFLTGITMTTSVSFLLAIAVQTISQNMSTIRKANGQIVEKSHRCHYYFREFAL